MSSAAYVQEGKGTFDVPDGHAAITLILPRQTAVILGKALQAGRESATTEPFEFSFKLTGAHMDIVSDQTVDIAIKFGRALALFTQANRAYRQQRGNAGQVTR
jgi:hypothetical protein